MSRAVVHSQSYHQGGHQGHQYPSAMKQGSGPREGKKSPSRLLQMRDDYQLRLLKEKEEKMINMYEDNQRRNQERAERVTRGGGPPNNHYPNSKLAQPGHMVQQHQQQQQRERSGTQVSSSPSLREFFRERRELEAKGGYVPPIDQHYKQSKSRTSSSNSFHKTSAGVDRSQPLAPIPTNARPAAVVTHHPTSSLSSSSSSPFSNKPRLVRHATSNSNNNNGSNGNVKTARLSENEENDNYRVNQHDNHRGNQQARNSPRKPAPPVRGKGGGGCGSQRSPDDSPSERMTDFQKWQMEQSKAREDRLKKANRPAPQQDWDGGNEEGGEGGRGGGRGGRSQSKEQERALMEKIAQQQTELERMKRERDEEAELERREAERQRQEAAERDRRRRQQQQEEARRRREEEAQAKREREEQQRKAKTRAKDSSSTPRNPPPRQQRNPPPPQQRRPRTPEDDDPAGEDDVTPVPGLGNEIYDRAVDGEQGGKVKLVPCKLCGRKFAHDRVQKHQTACKKVQKKRKVMDPTQMRTEGTDMAKYVSKGTHKEEPPKKKADWRRQHQEFIANIRYAKKMQQMEQQGVSPRDLPPPPPSSQNPGPGAVPALWRTFNQQSAERHIPRCQQLKTRPAATRRR